MSKILLVICLGMIVLISCNTSDESPKILGCIDSLSLNYDKLANTDDGSCIFPADKLVGTWAGKDEVSFFSGTTLTSSPLPVVNYNAVVSKTDKTKISITGDQPTKPVYLYKDPLTVNWIDKKIGVPFTSVTGTIISENSFSVSYVYGIAGGAYTVKQTYTR
jgi:hypothetical protein